MDRGADCAKTIQETLGGKADKIYNLSLKDSRQSFEASLRLNLQSLVAEISQDLQQSLNDDMEICLPIFAQCMALSRYCARKAWK